MVLKNPTVGNEKVSESNFSGLLKNNQLCYKAGLKKII
jgi:hypothetical protein